MASTHRSDADSDDDVLELFAEEKLDELCDEIPTTRAQVSTVTHPIHNKVIPTAVPEQEKSTDLDRPRDTENVVSGGTNPNMVGRRPTVWCRQVPTAGAQQEMLTGIDRPRDTENGGTNPNMMYRNPTIRYRLVPTAAPQQGTSTDLNRPRDVENFVSTVTHPNMMYRRAAIPCRVVPAFGAQQEIRTRLDRPRAPGYCGFGALPGGRRMLENWKPYPTKSMSPRGNPWCIVPPYPPPALPCRPQVPASLVATNTPPRCDYPEAVLPNLTAVDQPQSRVAEWLRQSYGEVGFPRKDGSQPGPDYQRLYAWQQQCLRSQNAGPQEPGPGHFGQSEPFPATSWTVLLHEPSVKNVKNRTMEPSGASQCNGPFQNSEACEPEVILAEPEADEAEAEVQEVPIVEPPIMPICENDKGGTEAISKTCTVRIKDGQCENVGVLRDVELLRIEQERRFIARRNATKRWQESQARLLKQRPHTSSSDCSSHRHVEDGVDRRSRCHDKDDHRSERHKRVQSLHHHRYCQIVTTCTCKKPRLENSCEIPDKQQEKDHESHPREKTP